MSKITDISLWGSNDPLSMLSLGTGGIFRDEAIVDDPVIITERLPRHYPRMLQIGKYEDLFPRFATVSNIHTHLKVLGRALDKIDDKAMYLKKEFLPTTATLDGLLLWWEDLVGIKPDNSKSLTQRRNHVVAKLRARGGLSKPYFQALAEGLGYNYGETAPLPRIWFEEGQRFAGFRLGYNHLGDTMWIGTDIDLFKPFKLGESKLGDKFWSSAATGDGHRRMVIIHGTNIENDTVLRNLFNKLHCLGVKFRYRSE